jgi:hypothetical protein
MIITDTITAWQLDEDEEVQVLYQNDPVEVDHIVKETDTVLIRGYSNLTGERVTYFIPYDTEVDLWTA